jgi:hypothetical protein
MKAYPDNIKEISFLAALDESSPYAPWFAGLGALGYWGIGQFGTRYPRPVERREDPRRRAGDRHRPRCAAASSTATPT